MPEDAIIQFISLWQSKLQLMSINVVLDKFLNIKVSQGSVSTHLRCDGIFSDQLITQSVTAEYESEKKILNWSTIAEVVHN